MFRKTFEEKTALFGTEERKYLIHFPVNLDTQGKHPVVLFLHGAGERGDDNIDQLAIGIGTALADENSPLHDSFIVAPQVPLEKLWVDTPWHVGNYLVDEREETPYLAGAVNIIREILETYADKVDKSKVFVMGISMGGYGSWDTLARHPEVFTGGFICCGGADLTKADIFKEKTIFTYHGNADDVVPCFGTQNVVKAIKDAGGERITYREYDGVNHWSWDRAYAEYDDINALFAD